MKTAAPATVETAPATRGRARNAGTKPDAEFSVSVLLPGGFFRTIKVRAASEQEAAEKASEEAFRIEAREKGGRL